MIKLYFYNLFKIYGMKSCLLYTLVGKWIYRKLKLPILQIDGGKNKLFITWFHEFQNSRLFMVRQKIVLTLFVKYRIKVHLFWEGHKILQNFHQLFDWQYIGQIIGGLFAKFCCLLRIYELYQFHEYFNHLKKIIKMAVILMDLLHTRILLRFILLSDVIFEFVLIFADNLRVFYSFFGRLVR